MKRFIITILSVAVFFVGLGSLVENVGARFKSDEKALDLVRKARVAIGGDAAINAVQSMRIVGKTTRSSQPDQAETEIAFQFPDKLIKMIKIGSDDGSGTSQAIVDKRVEVVRLGNPHEMKVTVDATGEGSGAVRKIVIRKDDGTVQELTGEEAAKFVAKNHPGGPGVAHTITLKKNPDGTVEQVGGEAGQHVIVRKADGTGGTATFTSKDGKTFNIDGRDIIMERTAGGPTSGGERSSELLRTTLSLLLTAPQGMDVSYTFGGESDVDGTVCNIVVAEFGGTSYKIFLNRSSNLPVMMSYSAPKMTQVFLRTAPPKMVDDVKENMMFTRTTNGPGETAEYSVKFSDYRAVGGVQLPYKWTQTVGGNADETFDVTNYEINPANIAEKFQGQPVMVRVKKPDNK